MKKNANTNTIVSLMTVSKAQSLLTQNIVKHRLSLNLSQEGLAKRSAVSIATIRKFEQKGIISLQSFLKLLMVLDRLDSIVEFTTPKEVPFLTIDEVLKHEKRETRKRGQLK